MSSEQLPTLADRLAEALAANGATTIFGMPGGGPNLDMVGAIERCGLRFVLAHGETEAAIMASTHGLLTGATSGVIVTRGPGAASLTNGLAQATLDRYPLVAVTDTVPSASASRVAHQRIDQRAMLAPVAKQSETVSDVVTASELHSLVAASREWPYGGIHIDFDPSADRAVGRSGVAVNPEANAGEPDVSAAAELLAKASRPLVIVGMEAAVIAARQHPSASTFVADLARLGCPVLTTYQAVGVVPTEGEANAGLFTNGALERPVLDAADVIVTVGLDLVEPIPARWRYDVPVIRLSATVQTDDYLHATVDLVGDPADTLAALVACLDQAATGRVGPWGWETGAAERFRAESRSRLADTPTGRDGEANTLGPLDVVEVLAAAAPPDATVTVDAGAHFLAIMPNWPVSRPLGLLISNGLATMGFAVPAAIGAALARPGTPVLALTGDGGLSMVLAELETIARLDLPITVVVFNDSALSLIEIKQQAQHGGPGAVRYRPVDFAAAAMAQGLAADVVTTAAELQRLLHPDEERGSSWMRPRLIDARIDPAAYRHLISATRG